MPSSAPPPVLHDCAVWSPYQQQTSVARVIESPIEAMLVGSGGAADAVGTSTAATRRLRTNALRAIGILMPQWRDSTPGGSAGRCRRLRRGRQSLGAVA